MKKNLGLLVILVVLAGLAYYMFSADKKSTIASNPLSNFKIEDTASVTKIFISDKVSGKALLTKNKETGYWMINEKYRAKEHAVKLLLEAFKNISVKGPVSENKKKTVISNASATGKKIEIYTNDSEVPEKIWISAGNTPDHHGDFFILEIPGKGISPEPFIVDMPMFSGFLTARFFTFETDWRYSGVFDYPNLEFNEITVTQNEYPERSFKLEWDGGTNMKVSNPVTGEIVNHLDSFITKDYILRYKKIHLEVFKNYLEPNQVDSVLARVPDWKISVKQNDEEIKSIDLFRLLGNGDYHDFEGNPHKYNQDIMYGTMGNGELFKVQYGPVFKPLMIDYDYFTMSNGGSPQ